MNHPILGKVTEYKRDQRQQQHAIFLNREQIIALLCNADFEVPNCAKVTITVPRGGDYSGDVLDVGDMVWVRVMWGDDYHSGAIPDNPGEL